MNKKEFEKYLARDKACAHCGSAGQDLIPHHRANRGMGGSKSRNRPSNIMVICSEANGLMESSATFATLARYYGWKLLSNQDPTKTPARLWDGWQLLDDNFGRRATAEPEQE
jgi:hypothetical protein